MITRRFHAGPGDAPPGIRASRGPGADPTPRSGPEIPKEVFVKVKPRVVEKPWGHELIWAETAHYLGKILHVKAGEALSLQYHKEKDETIHLLSGRMRLWAGSLGSETKEVVLERGESFHITPFTVHRMEAIEDCDILEASTSHIKDVVRLEDRYGRA
jgi:mannose-6-phosphate isomerase-like protein (cupin superfamily)